MYFHLEIPKEKRPSVSVNEAVQKDESDKLTVTPGSPAPLLSWIIPLTLPF
jgi:hypothetical protein